MLYILVNDIFDEILNENKRLLNELLFADKCIKVLNEIKEFIELNSNEIKVNLVSKQLKVFNDLCQTIEEVFREKNSDINLQNEEEENFDDHKTETSIFSLKKTSKNVVRTRNRSKMKSKTKLSCDQIECQYETYYNEDLLQHKNIHSENKFVCDRPNCQYRSYKKSDLRRHLIAHKKGSKRMGRMKTKSKQKNKSTKELKDYKFICHYSDCGKGYNFEKSYKNHLFMHQISERKEEYSVNVEESSDNIAINENNSQTNSSSKKEFICHYSDCGQRFSGEKSWRNHLWKHTKNEKLFVCHYPGCEYKSNNGVDLRGHIRRHTGEKPYKCKNCDKAFATSSQRTNHNNHVHNLSEKVLICGIDGCEKKFRTEVVFNKHQKYEHLFEKRFVCDYPNCDFRAAIKDLLLKHTISKHTTERPFKCSFNGCLKSFKSHYKLNQHISTHTTAATIKCHYPGCDKTFKFEDYLKKHFERNHSDNWLFCDWPGCEYKCRRKSMLESHSVSHSNEYTVSCIWPNCDKKFKTKIYMRGHLLIHKGEKRHVLSLAGMSVSVHNSRQS